MRNRVGDTLIEVTLAVGVFSMVAIAAVTVLSNGTSDAQTALETTLAREEIDTQAEALRFIQNAYIADKDNVESNDKKTNQYVNLWKSITSRAVVDDIDGAIKYSPADCSELYGEDSQTAKYHGFVINPRTLSKTDDFDKALSTNLAPTTTYPRLLFSGNDTGLYGSLGDDLISAEGIYVIGVKDASSTKIIDSKNGTESAFYDFYIRTCWYASNNDRPVTISTVIRLYDPDALSDIATKESWQDTNHYSKYAKTLNAVSDGLKTNF